MTYDRFLESETNSYLDSQDELGKEYDNAEKKVIDAIKINGKVFSNGRGFSAADGDLHDKIAGVQVQIMQAYVNDNDAEILALVKQCCSQEINSLIDLLIG